MTGGASLAGGIPRGIREKLPGVENFIGLGGLDLTVTVPEALEVASGLLEQPAPDVAQRQAWKGSCCRHRLETLTRENVAVRYLCADSLVGVPRQRNDRDQNQRLRQGERPEKLAAPSF